MEERVGFLNYLLILFCSDYSRVSNNGGIRLNGGLGNSREFNKWGLD